MINSVKVTNRFGESVTIELRNPEKSGFLIRDISGLDPVRAIINTTEMVSGDGVIFNSSRAGKRNIVLNLIYRNQETYDIETNRRVSYRYFPLKSPVLLEINTSERVCSTYGFVESNEVDLFSQIEGSVVSIVCPDPYFYSTTKKVTVFSNLEGQFEFPFSNESLTERLIVMGERQLDTSKTIIYDGDSSVGITIYIHAIGPVENLSIYNLTTNKAVTIDNTRLVAIMGTPISAGDDVIISTERGNKFAVLQREGLQYNILNALEKNPEWFQLERGENIFAYTATSGVTNLQFRIVNKVAFEGV